MAQRAMATRVDRLAVPGVGLGYYAGCLVGFALRFPSSGISFLWPPTAVLTTALLLTAPGRWAGLLLGAFVAHGIAHAQDGVPAGTWPVQFLGNAVQAMLAAAVVRRYSSGGALFADVRAATAFIIGASILAPALASIIPAHVYVTLGWAADFWQAWRARTVSNTMASLTLIPPLVAAYRSFRHRPPPVPARRVAEFALLLLSLTAAHLAAVQFEGPGQKGLSLALYAPAPFLFWAVVRYGATGLSCALLCAALVTITTALRAHGPLVGATAADTVIAVQMFIGVSAMPLMLIAGLLEENRTKDRTVVESERKNSAILRAMPDAMFLQSRDGVYLTHYARSPGQLLVPPETFLGKNMSDILPADVAARFSEAFREASAEQPAIVEYSLAIDGVPRHYEARCITLESDKILSIVRDTTERRRSEAALQQANAELIHMARVTALGKLTASIAHEVNQPLCAIVANANACLRWIDAGTGGDVRGALNDIVQDSHRASEVIRRTRELFTNRVVHKEPLDLNRSLQEALTLAHSRLTRGGVVLDLRVDPALPVVYADPLQIQTVILNLVLNAVDAMRGVKDRPRLLHVQSRRAKELAIVTVRDTGEGLRGHDVERIFDPFYTTKPDGMGIGLAISRSIVKAHGGALWAIANDNGSATFRFRLPAMGGEHA
jgi:signal transduction histidine kinase